MLIDENQIEQLVLDEMGGVITPEDSATLGLLLKKEPQAVIIKNSIYNKFSEPTVQALLHNLPQQLPVEKVWAKIRRRK
jgi:transmembrane sensor